MICWAFYHFDPNWHMSQTTGWIAMKPCTDIYVPQRMDHTDFEDVSSPIVPPGGWHLWFYREMLLNCWMDCHAIAIGLIGTDTHVLFGVNSGHPFGKSLHFLSSAIMWSKLSFQDYTLLTSTFYSWRYEHASMLTLAFCSNYHRCLRTQSHYHDCRLLFCSPLLSLSYGGMLLPPYQWKQHTLSHAVT